MKKTLVELLAKWRVSHTNYCNTPCRLHKTILSCATIDSSLYCLFY